MTVLSASLCSAEGDGCEFTPKIKSSVVFYYCLSLTQGIKKVHLQADSKMEFPETSKSEK